MNTYEKILSAVGLAVLGALLALAFGAYLSPAMLLEFSDSFLCG